MLIMLYSLIVLYNVVLYNVVFSSCNILVTFKYDTFILFDANF
jgi:hypothetical protein